MNCITKYFNSKSNKIGECPFCRTKIGFQGITIMEDNVNNIESSKNILLSKQEYFMKLILENKQKKWLVFSEFDATFNSLLDDLSNNNITYSKICGTASHIDNLINNFNNGLINVLLLNAVNFGMGINLEMATDVLIYHKLSSEIEKQVIGRAQRPGRILPLNVHFLSHDNEYQYYSNRQVNNNNIVYI
jgi:ERCC4-related helicase